ncbi:helix-turn-helix transcriptional regulator [Oceanibaculum indicum]|uniref:AraC family transcriptional regulator n=2 Tax=Oceanibaculum indicum TaxID=526216 RepID=K2J433_9PROT|nr:AraC family transcriptional regulator [Oceanibaculum indicum]EKE77761.1 AraC family transcriptional regulator [Oceanibaculum indicum P24]RKQ73280.1 AraC-like DNA-binding protein [Oceanibaculum indicum]
MNIAPAIHQEKVTQTDLARGDGWSVSDVICRCGPEDKPYEEQHGPSVIAAVLSGNFVYRSDRGSTLMAAGSLMLGNAGACYSCGHEHGAGDRCLAFHFTPGFLEDVAGGLPGLRWIDFPQHRLPPMATLTPLFAAAETALLEEDAPALEELALRMAGAALRLSHADSPPPDRARDIGRIAAAARLIEEHYTEPLTIADIAARVGLSRYHFLRLFSATMGMTPYQYLLNRRLRAAARTLRADRRSVLDAALSSGFGDLSEFTRRFRRTFGQTPASYRSKR